MTALIFLDFDGVIVTPKQKPNKTAVANLNHLIEQTGAEIVVSSTWRLGGGGYVRRCLRSWGCVGS